MLWHGNQQDQLSLLFTGNGCERSNLIRLPENVVEHVADYVTLDRDDRAAAAAVVEIEQEERRLLAQEGSHKFPFASTTKTTFLNHGGCSGPCVGALALKRTVDEMANRQPMEWHRAVAPALVARAEDTVASYVGCRDPERLHFVENVSVGILVGSRPLAPWIDASWFDTGSPSYRIDHLTRGLYDEATRDYANFIVLPLCVAIARRREPAFLAHRAKMLPKVLSNAPGLDSLALHWGSPPLVCESMCVSMASLFLPTDRLLSLVPAGPRGAINFRLKKLKTFVHDYLWNTHAIEVPCFAFDDRLCVRISLPEYVGETCLDRLRAGVDALLALADETRRQRETNAQ